MNKRKRLIGFGFEEVLGKKEWEDTYKWFLELVDSEKGKIESLSEEGYNNWLLSLFYVAGVDKADVVMKKEKGVEAVKQVILTAYHEAGHAVYEWLAGVTNVFSLHIIAHPIKRRGVCHIQQAIDLVCEEDEVRLKRAAGVALYDIENPNYDFYIDTFLAGCVAEDILLQSFNLKARGMSKSSTDYQYWEHLLGRKYPDDDEKQKRIRLAQHYRRVKRNLLEQELRLAVREVAEKLLIQAYVSHDELMEIINRIPLRQFLKKKRFLA